MTNLQTKTVPVTRYMHHVSGFFLQREEAEIALSKLSVGGIPIGQLSIFDIHTVESKETAAEASNAMRKNMIVNGAYGAAIGSSLGVLAEVALTVANVSLLVASPLLAPLVMLGWGASLGAVIGAVAGSEHVDKVDANLAELVHDAIMNGQVVLVATTLSAEETHIAQQVIQEAVGVSQDQPV